MRVVCLVPSWTETLLEAGVEVVGRTRFCIHPAERVKNIPIVGGTKDVDWQVVQGLSADLVLFDREENTLEMAKDCPLPWYATHVRSLEDLPQELQKLSLELKTPALEKVVERWRVVIQKGGPKVPLTEPPALVHWITPGASNNNQVVYVIWAKPWMAAGDQTFIGSVMRWCGVPIWGVEKYPRFLPNTFDEKTLFLCSTEPYPFSQRQDVTQELPGPVALVDGEKISWFGVRSLSYLESLA